MPAVADIPAIERAIETYEAHGLVLAEHLQDYLRHPHGVLIKRADLVVLARPVVLDDPERWLGLDEAGEANAWYVQLLAGRVSAALALMPYRLPWCCWHRQFRDGPLGRLHVVATDQLLRRTNHG